MKLEEFFKPKPLKIILLIILLWFISGHSYRKLCSCMIEPWMCEPIYCNNWFALIGIFIVPAYLLSCLLSLIYIKIRKLPKKYTNYTKSHSVNGLFGQSHL